MIITKDSDPPHNIAVPSIVKSSFSGVICGYHLAILRPKVGVLISGNLNKLLQLKKYRHYFFSLSNGVTRFGLNVGAIKAAKIPLPPLAEQQRIAAILSTCDEEIETLRQLAEARQWQKRGLMQQLLTGKKRVRV